MPTSALGHAEQTTLGKLSDGELLRVRNERIQFSHDLLSDWSRLKVLVGEDWLATPAARERYASPKWFKAYDRIDSGEDITRAVTRIMNESESLALAGLLLTVAKRKPELLIGPLSPLLESWVLVEWDFQLTS